MPRASLPLRFDQSLWTRGRSPGVNTHLSAHERRVYMSGLQWIEDFACLWGRSRRRSPMCCPPEADHTRPACRRSRFRGLGSYSSPRLWWRSQRRRLMRLRYPASAERLPPRAPSPIPSCHTAIPFASIWLGLGLAELLNKG
jgi:hypothetical protein